MQKWVSVWGNAVSIAENRPERYAKDITLRYPIVSPFSGSAVRLTFDNYCGTEPVTLEKVTIFCGGAFHPVTFGGERRVTLPAEGNAISDTLETPVTAGKRLLVSFYLRDFTLMRSVVFTCGALSGGLLAQYQKSCDINVGTGMVTIALASLIIGETLVGKRTMLRRILGVVFGSCLYRFIVAVALRFNVPAAAMKLVSAIIVAVAISMPAIREHFAFEKRRHAARARRTVTNREGQ